MSGLHEEKNNSVSGYICSRKYEACSHPTFQPSISR